MTGDIDHPGSEDQVQDNSADDETLQDGISDDLSEDEPEDTVVLSIDEGDVGGSTTEINVEKLVAKIEAEDPEEVARKREVREKVEALNEQRDDEFGSTYNFNIDDDL